MSLRSTALHLLGVVAGILIPGASSTLAEATHEVQQHFADLYGEEARDLAAKLSVDTDGMTTDQQIFAIADALVATAMRDGFKGDAQVLRSVLLDVAAAAVRASRATIFADIAALVSSMSSNPIAKTAETLVVAGAEAVARE